MIVPTSQPHEFEGRDGELLLTGLLLPEQRPQTFARFATAQAGLMLTAAQREKILSLPRKHPRKRYLPQTWIRRQINSGCNGFAAAGALGRSIWKKGSGKQPVVLSGDFIYSQINGGRDEGSMLNDGMQAMCEIGIAPDELVTVGTYRKGSISAEANAAAKRFKALECYGLDTEDELLSALCLDFVCVVAVHVGRGGYVNGPGNHSVCVDGLIDPKTMNSPGSWGLNQGDVEGCFEITFAGQLRETIKYHDFYAVRAALDDPQGEQPPG